MDPNLVPIPKLFHADLTGAPMDKCISCKCDLLDGSTNYVIEKAIKPYDGFNSYSTIFEYAMCLDCMDSYRGRISPESMERINKYFAEQINWEGRKKLMEEDASTTLNQWIGRCVIKDLEARDVSECQVYAHCIGGHMVMGDYPYMISGVAMDEVVELLSPETFEAFDRLKDELIGPSEFQDLLQGGPRVFL